MTDFDHRYPGLKNAIEPASTTFTMTCPGCGKQTEVTSQEILTKLDPKYPSQRVVVECNCGEAQFVLEAKRKHGTGKTSVGN